MLLRVQVSPKPPEHFLTLLTVWQPPHVLDDVPETTISQQIPPVLLNPSAGSLLF
jgi:hypothetical protein